MHLDVHESHDLWTLSLAEQARIAAKREVNRLSFAVLLKYFGIYARFPTSLADLDRGAVAYLAEQLGVDVVIRGEAAELHRTIKRYRAEIRAFFGFREATIEDAQELTNWLRDHAVVEGRNRKQLAEALELECRQRSLEPPAPDRVDRIVRAAVRAYEERFYHETYGRLSTLSRERLDAILRPPEGDGDDEEASTRAVINMLRSDPGRVGVKSIREEVAKLAIIRRLELPEDLFAHARPHELELYRQRVAVETPWELRRHPEEARLTWLAAFAYLQGRAITDALTDLLIDTIHRINAKADRRVSEMLLDDLKHVTGKTTILFQLADATLAHPDEVVRDVIFPIVSESTLRDLVKEWKATGPGFRNTLRTFIRSSYKSHYRRMVPQLLETLDFRSNNSVHRPVIRALEVIKRYAGTKLHSFPVGEQIPLDFVPPLWRDAVVEEDAGCRPRVNRITYEIAALNALRDQVRCKEIHVAGADRYRNPDEDVPTDFESQREAYYGALQLPRDPEVFIVRLRDEMREALQTFHDGLPRNAAVRITKRRFRTSSGWDRGRDRRSGIGSPAQSSLHCGIPGRGT
jgi:hypothetical protein